MFNQQQLSPGVLSLLFTSISHGLYMTVFRAKMQNIFVININI